jgi:prevent-host-death family protein
MKNEELEETTGMRDLRNNLSAYVRMVERSRKPIIVHVHGRPVAALAPVTRCGEVDLTGEEARPDGGVDS